MDKLRVFLSYTNREEEIQKIKPLIDAYCRNLLKWAQLNEIEIFYDDFTMRKRQYSDEELEKILGKAVDKSQLMTAFLSPEYVTSEWCQFEYVRARKNRHKNRETVLHAILWKPIPLNILP